MGKGGYYDKTQKQDLPVMVPGAGAQVKEEFSKNGGPFETVESPMNTKADGDLPTFASEPFANGKDLRNRS